MDKEEVEQGFSNLICMEICHREIYRNRKYFSGCKGQRRMGIAEIGGDGYKVQSFFLR